MNGNMDWSKQQATVIGGSGFLGKYLVERLMAQGCGKVVSFSRRGDSELEKHGVSVIRGDLRDAKAVRRACSGSTVVFHTAAKAGVWGRFRDYYDINVTGTVNVLHTCRELGICNLIYTSSPSVAYPPTLDIAGEDETLPYPERYLAHYPATKAIAERMVIDFDWKELSAIALRPHLIWGPRDPHLLPRVIKAARAGSLAIVGDGHNMVDLTYVVNAAAAHIMAAEYAAAHPGCRKKYFVSDNNPVNLWDWNNRMLSRLGIDPITRHISYRKAYAIGAIMEAVFRLFPPQFEPPITRFVAGQLAFSHYFNIGAAQCDLGYHPVVSPEEAIEKTVDWLKTIRETKCSSS